MISTRPLPRPLISGRRDRCSSSRAYECGPALDTCLRSSSSRALKARGHASANHRLLTMLSSCRPSASIAHASRLTSENRQKLRPHLRHRYERRDPRAADQSSILNAKSWVRPLLLSTVMGSRASAATGSKGSGSEGGARSALPCFGPCRFSLPGRFRF